jgi:HlyD family type I secretion membrane fusion protein
MIARLRPAAAAEGRWSAAPYMRLGMIACLALVFGLGAWATFASISGAVIAEGQVAGMDERRVVQHDEGGTVVEVSVREGDRVAAGDRLLRLDARRPRAELTMVENRLHEIVARIGRLEAEQQGAEAIAFDAGLMRVAAARADVAALVEGQVRLFDARRQTAAEEAAQLRERQSQIRTEVSAASARRASLERQMALVERELTDQQTLFDKGLAQAGRVLGLEREHARLDGEAAALAERMSELEGRITEIDIQLTARRSALVEEAIAHLRDLRAEEADLREQAADLRDVIDQRDIRARTAGVVLGQRVSAPGAVLRPAEPILYLVPEREALTAHLRLAPIDVDQVHVGQAVRLRFPSLNQRTTPEVETVVLRIAPETLEDEHTGAPYFPVEVEIAPRLAEALGGPALVAGMPVEAFFQTGERSPLAYLAQPVTDFFAKALKER